MVLPKRSRNHGDKRSRIHGSSRVQTHHKTTEHRTFGTKQVATASLSPDVVLVMESVLMAESGRPAVLVRERVLLLVPVVLLRFRPALSRAMAQCERKRHVSMVVVESQVTV
jgi:hypothetical protein